MYTVLRLALKMCLLPQLGDGIEKAGGACLHERVNRFIPNYVVLTSHPNHQLFSYRLVIDGKLSYL